VTIPIRYRAAVGASEVVLQDDAEWTPDPSRIPILVVEGSPEALQVYEGLFGDSSFQVVPARTVREAEWRLETTRPRAVVLDIALRGEDAWSLLARIKEGKLGAELPVLVVSDGAEPGKSLALHADGYSTKPVDRAWLLGNLRRLTSRPLARALIVDDDEAARYVLRSLLRSLPLRVEEATGGQDGLRRLREERPDLVFLDLVMPDLTGFELLEEIRQERETSDLPVVIMTSKMLSDDDTRRLARGRAVVMPKAGLGHPDALAHLQDAIARAGWQPRPDATAAGTVEAS
jgi:CheY-like chemotaxis protein